MFGLFGILTTLIGKLPVLGPWIAKLWTDNSKVAEIEAETNLEETKAFVRGRYSPKFILRYGVVALFLLFATIFIARMIWPDFAPGMTMDNFERLMIVAGNVLKTSF